MNLIESSKMIHLPHQNILVAVRGSQRFLLEVFAALWVSADSSTLDQIEEWLPSALDAGAENMIRSFRSQGLENPLIGDIELYVVGWSLKRNRMLGFRHMRSSEAPKFTGYMIDEYSIAPDLGWTATNPPPIPSDIVSMLGLAKEQVLFAQHNHSEAAIGGRLLVAEITKGSFTLHSAGDL